MVNVVAAAVKNAPWQDADGIIKEGANTASDDDGVGFKGTNFPKPSSSTECPLMLVFVAVFIRGLHEAFARNAANNDLRNLIVSYGDVQVRDNILWATLPKLNVCLLKYNALLDLAANGTSYSASWHGPPQAFTSWGQLSALDVLVSSVDMNRRVKDT